MTAHRVVIDCDCRRVTAYTQDCVCIVFQGDKHGALPRAMYDFRWHGRLMGWLASLTLEDEARQELSLPRVVYEYEDVFPEELPGLPLYRAWVEIGYRAHRPRLRGPRGMSTPFHLRLSRQISRLFRVCIYCRAYGQESCSVL